MTEPVTVPEAVFAEVVALLTEITGDEDLLGLTITPDTTFHDDLQLESVDLVAFAGILGEHFGERVNLAEYLSDLDLDDVIALTVGRIADYVTDRIAGVVR